MRRKLEAMVDLKGLYEGLLSITYLLDCYVADNKVRGEKGYPEWFTLGLFKTEGEDND